MQRTLFGRSALQNQVPVAEVQKTQCKQTSLDWFCLQKPKAVVERSSPEKIPIQQIQNSPESSISELLSPSPVKLRKKVPQPDASARCDVLSLNNTRQYIRWRNNQGSPLAEADENVPGPRANRELKRVLAMKAKHQKRLQDKKQRAPNPRHLDAHPDRSPVLGRRAANKLGQQRQDIRQLSSGETYDSEEDLPERPNEQQIVDRYPLSQKNDRIRDESWAMNSALPQGDFRVLKGFQVDIHTHLRTLEVGKTLSE